MATHERLAASTLGLALGLTLVLGPLACAGGGGSSGRGWRNQTPQLYPTAHYQQVGPEQARMDIDNCMYRADHGAPQKSVAGDAAVNTLGGAAAGAALGAIGGAIAGNAGTGAAIGAATGATLGVGKTVYDQSKPAQAYRGYVEACLRERGYDVIGWQ